MVELTETEKRALAIALKFRIDLLKRIETEHGIPKARQQIDALVSVAEKLVLP